MNIIGKATIFVNDYNGKTYYNTSISNKDVNGNYENMSISIQFPKNAVIHHKAKVNITKGFLTFYKKNNGEKVPKIVVMEYQLENQQTQKFPVDEMKQDPFNNPSIDIMDSDLPF